MTPTVDEIQQAINQLTDLVLEVSKGVTWQRGYSHDATKNKGESLSACTRMKIKLKDRQKDNRKDFCAKIK